MKLKTWGLIVSFTNRTEPSQNRKLQPPGCRRWKSSAPACLKLGTSIQTSSGESDVLSGREITDQNVSGTVLDINRTAGAGVAGAEQNSQAHCARGLRSRIAGRQAEIYGIEERSLLQVVEEHGPPAPARSRF